ncbi:MAG: cytochrome c oxidase assembly protein [Hyphomicrobiales bacterium]|nr:MAG: cytochrome c oxidase assembly protein [Hyphomicrobiales bacterium]
MANQQTPEGKGNAKNLRVGAICLGLVFGMGGMAYAAVPLYKIFCQVTGFGGTTQRVDNMDGIKILDREITVIFDANMTSGLDWRFKPVQRRVKVKLGELKKISYMAENLSDKTLTGTATFNVTPQAIGAYFNKIECFCFTDTRIEPHGKLDMPVVFFIDPDLDQEEILKSIESITLSYTFFPTKSEAPERVSSANQIIDGTDNKL